MLSEGTDRTLPGIAASRLADEVESLSRAARRHLAQLCSDLVGDRVPAEIQVFVGDPPEGLRRAAQRTAATLIVLGTQGRHERMHTSLGSTAVRLCASSYVPVVLVPRSDAAAAVPLVVLPSQRHSSFLALGARAVSAPAASADVVLDLRGASPVSPLFSPSNALCLELLTLQRALWQKYKTRPYSIHASFTNQGLPMACGHDGLRPEEGAMITLQLDKSQLPKSIKRITLLRAETADGSFGNRAKARRGKKQRKRLRKLWKRVARRSALANESASGTYLGDGGWLLPFGDSWVRTFHKVNEKFKLPMLFV